MPTFLPVAVAGSAIKWMRDSMAMIASAADINTLAAKVPDTGGVYFVTAFSGLLAPYWDTGAAGLLIGSALLVDVSACSHYDARYIAVHQPFSHCPCHARG